MLSFQRKKIFLKAFIMCRSHLLIYFCKEKFWFHKFLVLTQRNKEEDFILEPSFNYMSSTHPAHECNSFLIHLENTTENFIRLGYHIIKDSLPLEFGWAKQGKQLALGYHAKTFQHSIHTSWPWAKHFSIWPPHSVDRYILQVV